MIQSEGFNIIYLMNPLRAVSKIVNKAEDLSTKVSLNDIIKATDTSRKIIKNFLKVFGKKVTLTNDEIKDVIVKKLTKKYLIN